VLYFILFSVIIIIIIIIIIISLFIYLFIYLFYGEFSIEGFWDVTLSLGEWFLVFQRNIVCSSSQVKYSIVYAWPWEVNAPFCFEISAATYPVI
jgi:hypothetical protein